MEFRPLKSSNLIEYEELPHFIYARLTGDIIVWGGFDDNTDEMLGLVAFSPDPVDKTRAFLDYIHVNEKHRREGVGSALLKNLEQQLAYNRIASIYLKAITDEDFCKPVFDFFVKNDYVPTVFNGRLLEFDVSAIKTDEILSSFSETLLNKLKIESFSRIEPIIKKKILAICWANKISVTEQVINSDYTMIMNKMTVDGLLAVQRINDDKLYIWDCYIRDKKTRDATFLSLLAATVRKAMDDGKLNPHGTVVMSLAETTMANTAIKYLGKPKQDMCQQEFSKLLRR